MPACTCETSVPASQSASITDNHLGSGMRLLEIDTEGGLSITSDLQHDEIPSYAILSHTWAQWGEVSYQDMISDAARTKDGWQKIESCARQAKSDGYRHIWIDTCCIDKTNSVELSEAINSMFRWYAQAQVCYVHLADVSSGDDVEEQIRRSRWFSRGWTLQELLAPSIVRFYSQDWEPLGDKTTLERLVASITRLPAEALRGASQEDFSITERLSWQESRQTTKEEDRAYSLLGIFGVHMPLIYGEGRVNAFRRLKVEIESSAKGVRRDSFSLTFSLDATIGANRFVARRDELQRIRLALRSSSDGERRVVVIHGLGGIGKTQLMTEYAKRNRAYYSAILWLNSTSHDSLRASFANITQQILREHPTAKGVGDLTFTESMDVVVDAVKSWLSLPKNDRWLLLFDNLDNPKVPGNTDAGAVDIRDFLPYACQGSVIVTTRSSQLRVGQALHLKKFDDVQDGIEILSDASRRRDMKQDPTAIELATALDGLPLALATAGAYLEQSSVTYREYLHWYKEAWTKLQRTSPGLMSYEDRTLHSTWQVSFDQVKQRNALSAELLRLWAYFDHQDLWYELLCRTDGFSLQQFRPRWVDELTIDSLTFHEAMRVLCNHGLADPIKSGGYSIHPCVHSWTRSVLNFDWNPLDAAFALESVASHVPFNFEHEYWSTERRLLAHASRCLQVDALESAEGSVQTFHSLAILYKRQEMFAESEKMNLEALRRSEFQEEFSTFGANTLNNLGNLYISTGEHAKAEDMLERILEVIKPESVDVMVRLTALHNLALLYVAKGELVQALDTFRQAVREKQATLGPDDVSTLISLAYVGDIQRKLKNLDEAQRLLDQAHMGLEKGGGLNHPYTMRCMQARGHLYSDLGEYDHAVHLFKQLLEVRERTWGPEHIDTLRDVGHLSAAYHNAGDSVQAEALAIRAMEGYERRHGVMSLETARFPVYNLACLYRDLERFEEAIAVFKRVVRTVEADRDIQDQDVRVASTLAAAWTNIGECYRSLWRPMEAENAMLQALRVYGDVFGPDHPSTLGWPVVNLALLYASMGEAPKAEAMCARASSSYGELSIESQRVLDRARERLRELSARDTELDGEVVPGAKSDDLNSLIERTEALQVQEQSTVDD